MGGEGPEMSMGKLLSLAGRGGFMGQLLVFGVFLFFFFISIMQAGTASIACRALKNEH